MQLLSLPKLLSPKHNFIAIHETLSFRCKTLKLDIFLQAVSSSLLPAL